MIELNVDGMTCNHCVHAVTQAILGITPGAKVKVSLAAKRVAIEGEGSVETLVKAVTEAGYPATVAAVPGHDDPK